MFVDFLRVCGQKVRESKVSGHPVKAKGRSRKDRRNGSDGLKKKRSQSSASLGDGLCRTLDRSLEE